MPGGTGSQIDAWPGTARSHPTSHNAARLRANTGWVDGRCSGPMLPPVADPSGDCGEGDILPSFVIT